MSYKAYQWNIICDVCGFEFKSGQIRKRWDGVLVCKEDWEPDHPQKYIKVHSDPVPVPADLIRQEPPDTFVIVCTRYTSQSIAGVGVAGCMVTAQISNLRFDSYGNPL